jgi:hypothetical protein
MYVDEIKCDNVCVASAVIAPSLGSVSHLRCRCFCFCVRELGGLDLRLCLLRFLFVKLKLLFHVRDLAKPAEHQLRTHDYNTSAR